MAALSLIGALVGAVGSIMQGNAAAAQAKGQAKMLEKRANEERAVSHREAIRKTREAKMLQSRGQAVAAASGGGAADPTVVNLMGGIGAEGKYQSGIALYEGETKGRGLEFEAKLKRAEAKQHKLAGMIGAFSSVLNGLSSFGGSFGGGGTSMPSAKSGGGYYY